MLKFARFTRQFSSCRRILQVNKISDASNAITASKLQSGNIVLAGGFGLSGIPNSLISEILNRREIKNLTIASNNAGTDGNGLGRLLETKQISKLIVSYVGENKLLERMFLSGELDIDLTPQGTLAEKCASAGKGIPAFYTPTGVGTGVETGELPVRFSKDGKTIEKYSKPRESREFNGKKYLLEEALFGDVAIVKAYKADKLGNCMFRGTANNFNGSMARAAKFTIVEADEIVEVGEIKPTEVHIPGIYVNAVVQRTEPKLIERLTLAKSDEEIKNAVTSSSAREQIVKRAAQEFSNGMYANLGIGMPTLAPSFVDKSKSVQLQSENGVLGVGPYPQRGEEDSDMINAGKETITLADGASVFGSEESFGMIRSGRVDLSMLGAMQVSETGDLANWMLPGRVKGMGGAMDLVANPDNTRIVVTMEHCDKKGNSKIVKKCQFPLTGESCVSRIITDLCVFDVDRANGQLKLVELAPGVTEEEIKEKTEAAYDVAL